MDTPTVEFVDHDDWDDYVIVFVNNDEFGTIGKVSGSWVADSDLVRNLGYNRREPDRFTWGLRHHAEHMLRERVEYLAKGGRLVKASNASLYAEIATANRCAAVEHRNAASGLRAIGETEAADRQAQYALECDAFAKLFEEMEA